MWRLNLLYSLKLLPHPLIGSYMETKCYLIPDIGKTKCITGNCLASLRWSTSNPCAMGWPQCTAWYLVTGVGVKAIYRPAIPLERISDAQPLDNTSRTKSIKGDDYDEMIQFWLVAALNCTFPSVLLNKTTRISPLPVKQPVQLPATSHCVIQFKCECI